MKEIILETLTLKNFQGTRSRTINFGHITDISGFHETGKTTLVNGFTWLLFGKDSKGDTEFDLKPIDKKGNVIHGLETMVEGEFEINGNPITLKKVYTEDWTKKRGGTERFLTGHTTDCSVDGVPKKKGEFEKIRDEIIDENVFKMITDPYYFAEKIHWTVRRGIIFNMTGELLVEDVEATDKSLKGITELLEGKEVEEIQDKIAAQRRELNKKIKKLPDRIDEAELLIKNIDFDALRAKLQEKQTELAEIENNIETINEVDPALQKQRDEISQINKEIAAIEAEAEKQKQEDLKEIKDKISEAKKEKSNWEGDLEDDKLLLEKTEKTLAKIDEEIKTLESEFETESKKVFEFDNTELLKKEEELKEVRDSIDKLNKEIDEIRDKWHRENNKKFILNPDSLKCPTCKRELENIEAKKVELENNFNTEKEKELERINEEGRSKKSLIAGYVNSEIELKEFIANAETKQKEEFNKNKAKKLGELNHDINKWEISKTEAKDLITEISNRIEETKSKIEEATTIISGYQTQIDNYEIEYPEKYNLLMNEISKIQSGMKEPEDKTEKLNELKQQKTAINTEIKAIEKELNQEDLNKKQEKRVEELKKEERELSQQIADLEKQDTLCENYIKTKARLLESKINKLFKLARFKLFKEQINGGIRETCEVSYKGVSHNINDAGRINVGLDIINTLSEHYQVRAPIWLDRRESILDEYMIETKSQVINLSVSDDKEMKVEIKEKNKKVA